jgi:hypothetical protein
LFAIGCASSHNWTTRDIALESAGLALEVVDWRQTARVTTADEESNPIMGQHGQRVPAGLYFPVVMLANVLIAHALPHGWIRTGYQISVAGFQGFNAYRSEQMGYGY